jgi:peptide/nickel transport system substrate-binding protein
MELLQGMGWIDLDNDPNTPRQAQGVNGVVDGTSFQLQFLTLAGSEREQAAQIIQESLVGCGIGVDIRYLEANELFAPGPDGPIFGRDFDLAQFGWTASLEPRCDLYTTAEIPGPYPDFPKGWGGANASGYSNPEYDQACATARKSLPEEAQHLSSHRQAQAIFTEDLPVLPLYSRYRLVVARPDLCGLDVDPSAESVLWNVENFNYGDGCKGEVFAK